MILNVIVAFLISALMGLGIGGGGLFVIYLTQCLNFDQMTAQGTNLIFFIIAGVASLIFHFRRRKIYPMQVIFMVVFGVLGSLIFSHVANMVDPDIPRKVFGGLLLLSGIITISKELLHKK
ncbi:MAG: sulfite exporter TauE/SafE family protein [Clostridia bacterium]|nr:sulfite exporter TauE/SafE family protein [Clostridia bacterium]